MNQKSIEGRGKGFGKRTPGVPQISVSTLSLSSSMMRERPKSAIMMSASSAFVRNSKFSGFRSVHSRQELSVRMTKLLTPMDNPAFVDVLDGPHDSADEVGCIAARGCELRGCHSDIGATHAS